MTWHPQGGGGGTRVGGCPPTGKSQNNYSLYGGPFCYFFLDVGAFFWACPPPPKISAGAHAYVFLDDTIFLM